jgi:hypothetical protein
VRTLLVKLDDTIKNLEDGRCRSSSQFVWAAGKDRLEAILKPQWKVCAVLLFIPHPLILSI